METNRSRALQALSMPIANQEIAQRQEAARQIRLQGAMRQAPPTQKSEVQAAAGQLTQEAGQQAVQNQSQNQQQVMGLATQQLQAESDQQQNLLGQQKLELDKKVRDNENQLASLGLDIKRELFDDNMQFQKDEMGRTRFNQAQLSDWAIENATSEEDYKNKVQKMEQVHKMELQIMEAAQKKIDQQLEFEYAKKMQDRDNETIRRLAQYKKDMTDAYNRKLAAYKNRQGQWQAGATIAGAVIGGVMTGGAGTAAGAAAGAAIGGAAAPILQNLAGDKEPTAP